jgi:hypothetical protein
MHPLKKLLPILPSLLIPATSPASLSRTPPFVMALKDRLLLQKREHGGTG